MSLLRRNVPYLLQQSRAALSNTGVFGRVLCLLIVVGYLLSFWPAAVTALSVTPGRLLPPRLWLWTALTHCVLELHLWQVLVDIVTVALCTKLLEPLWGRQEMLFFFVLVNMLVALLAAVFYLLLYMCTSNPDLLFSVHIHGLAGYVSACSVAIKQIMPDHVLVRQPVIVTNSHMPLILVLVSALLYVCRLLDGNYVTQFTLGVLVSWTYLRFYQPHSNATRGDMASTFSFAQFFPSILQPVVAAVSAVIYSCLLACRLCRRPVKKYDVGAPSSITISLPGVDAHDAERRRQKALKALNDRLQRVEPVTAWPSLDEESAENQPLLATSISPVSIGTPSINSETDNSLSTVATHSPNISASGVFDKDNDTVHSAAININSGSGSDGTNGSDLVMVTADDSTSTTPSSVEIV